MFWYVGIAIRAKYYLLCSLCPMKDLYFDIFMHIKTSKKVSLKKQKKTFSLNVCWYRRCGVAGNK